MNVVNATNPSTVMPDAIQIDKIYPKINKPVNSVQKKKPGGGCLRLA